MKKRKKLGAERLSEFFRQFSVLVESGLSIPETLEIMQQDDTDREFCLACRKLGAFMTEGKTVGDAMEETGRFPEPAIQMIRAAEMSGQLVRTTARLAVQRALDVRSTPDARFPAICTRQRLARCFVRKCDDATVLLDMPSSRTRVAYCATLVSPANLRNWGGPRWLAGAYPEFQLIP